ncbi:tail length tape-measure protein 1 [Salmonella phage TS6]|uniref:Tail length tape-measure protein 1 n=1 Tax=Salmonella phage TS6 TaxID=2491323 RepID=A0A5S9EDR5_9CAUD|nr:tail length tape-measure protein 1 [Salmonella phage TS6]AZF89071.1 tail length tape-measure protein 1 [Salmonella phage TS6]
MADTASLIARVKTEGVSQAEDQLDAFASAAGKADTAAGKLGDTTQKQTTKLRGFGTGAQQVGYQVQDMIVQIQGGTSAFVAIGQQGSQLAGAFGPGGAVIGAIIALSAAVGGTLYKALGGAKISAEELQASAKTLEDVLQKNKDGVYELSDGFVKLANDTGTASQALARFYEAQSATVTQTEGAKEAITDLVDSLDSWTNGSAIGAQRSLELGQQTSSLTGYIEDLSDKFGITNKEAEALVPLLASVQKNASPENIKALSDETARLNDKYQGTNSELVKFNGELFKNIGQMQDAASKADALSGSQDKLGKSVNSTTQRLKEQNDQIIKNVQIGNLADKERYAAQAQADKEAFAKREGVTKEQIAAYNAARDEEARQDIQRVKDTEAKRAAAEQKAADTRASQQAKRAETEAQRQQNAARNFLDTLQRQNQDELAAIDAQEQQKLEKLQAFRDNETISQQQFEEAKTQIALDADAKRNEILQRQTEERIKKQFSADAYVAQMQALADSEFAELDRQYEVKLQKLNDFHSQGLITEDAYQQTLSAINDEYALSRAKATGDAFGDMAGNIGTALGKASTAYKAFAIAQATIATYTSAIEAYKSTAAIPVVGPYLAPVAAAAAVAAGLANIGKIRSAREQGGSLAAGQISTIAERGKPEVIMPAGASRVRTAEQMRQIMGESSGKSGGENITIVNNTTGRVDSVSQERDDEGRLRIIISETVSSALQDSNSAISKSRRATRGQPGY